jgi:acyl-CoA synthetase (NDP forming)
MQRVFADAGLPVERQFADGLIELRMPIPGHEGGRLDHYLDVVAVRASRADVASLRHLLQPASVAVIGAGRHRGSVGREILRNILAGGFAGPVYAVNPHGLSVAGATCLLTPADLPGGVDLAVICVPPAQLPAVADECGRRGVRVLIAISASVDGGGPELLAICRRYGMRLVGPNCFGIVSTAVGLNATFAARMPAAGTAGLVVQSGGVGVALLEHLGRLEIGISSFASVGDKYDVSSNDLLTWWEQDEQTSLAVLYLESFGSPRTFARTARRLGQQMPVLTVIGGRSAAGQRAAASHTAGATTPLITQEALFGQAGIVATRSLGELVDAAAFFSCQPLPAGRRVAIVTNSGGSGVLAADALGDHDLTVAVPAERTRRRLAAVLPAEATLTGPVDTTASVGIAAFRDCLEIIAADDTVDAVLAIAVPTAIAELSTAVLTASVTKPMVAALLDQPASVRLAQGARPGARIPIYGFPENAAQALAHAVSYREWRDSQSGRVPDLPEVDSVGARAMVTAYLMDHPAGGWLVVDDAADLLAYYQISVGPATVTPTTGVPATVVPTTGVPATVVPTTGAGADGVETLIGVVQEPVFGPLVVFGLGATDVLGDRSARLAPLTDADADELIRSVRAAPLLFGHGGAPAVDTGALADTLLRVSRLADDLPEVAELDLNPVIARPDGAHVVDVRVRIAPAAPRDPFLRQLR